VSVDAMGAGPSKRSPATFGRSPGRRSGTLWAAHCHRDDSATRGVVVGMRCVGEVRERPNRTHC
jgi:hypothetical protein